MTRPGPRADGDAARLPATWVAVVRVMQAHARALRRRSGVCGFGVGLALVGRRPTDEPALRIHVRRKLPGLSGRRALPRRLDGWRVDVVETRFAAAAGCPSTWPHARRDPLKGGVAIAPDGAAAFGTLGACGRDAAGRAVAVTAAHALGDVGARVLQPGDGGVVGRVAARILDPLVDVARVTLGTARAVAPDVRGWRIAGVLDPVPLTDLGVPVTVVGACSGFTAGRVTGVETEAEVDYDGTPMTVLDHYLVVADGLGEVTRGGDSGAFVLETATRRLVGMVRAGEPDGAADYALVAPIRRTLEAVHVTVG